MKGRTVSEIEGSGCRNIRLRLAYCHVRTHGVDERVEQLLPVSAALAHGSGHLVRRM